MIGRAMAMLAAVLLPVTAFAADPVLFDAAGYRTSVYRAPVSTTPAGVRRIDARATARAVDRGGAGLIDVMPAEGGRREPDGRWRLAKGHDGLPGAHWFPEAGRAPIDPAIEPWFLRGVDRLARAGRRDVRWFAEGGDGWRDLGRTLVPVQPEPAG